MNNEQRLILSLRIFLVTSFIIMMMIASVSIIKTRNNRYYYSEITTWHVTNGETLTGIVAKISDERHLQQKVIEELYILNADLTPMIYPGQQIIIPIYECMK